MEKRSANRVWKAALVYFVFVACTAIAQNAPAIANIDGRHTTSLNGKWQSIVDPYNVGSLDYRAKPLKNNNAFYKDHKPASRSELVEYDFDQAEQLNVPGDWNTQRESLFFYEGSVWYKRAFDYTPKKGTRVFLHFGAANYEAHIYLNGEPLGEHEGGFTPFVFEITNKLRASNNSLVALIDNTRRPEQVPTVNTDWWNYGGITRPVTLVEVPETFIQDYEVQLQKGSQRAIAGWVQLNGPELKQAVKVEIPEAGVARTIETDAKGRASFSFDSNVALWSPEHPKLYEVKISSHTDSVTERIGFRTIETRGTEILLNGQPIFLRGISVHAEAPMRTGRAWSEQDARTLLGWAKELGCNFVRLAHYPHSETMLRVADEMGILVWEEVPVYWTIEWENAATLSNAKNQINEAIARDRNRASLIIYSVSNETPVTEARTRFLRSLVQNVREHDNARLISAALQHREMTANGRVTVLIEDPLAEDLDIIGDNEYIGWYSRTPAEVDNVDWSSPYGKPVIVSEFGGDALYGYHGDADTRWTEEYQENLYVHQLRMLKRIPFLSGMTPWILTDFRSPRRTLPHIQEYFNRKGLLTIKGEKKKAYFVLQKYYRELQQPGAQRPAGAIPKN